MAALQAEQTRHAIHVIQLPYKVGTDGWLGHRMYGAAAFLSDADYLTYLDEDNWVDPDHAHSIIQACPASPTLVPHPALNEPTV